MANAKEVQRAKTFCRSVCFLNPTLLHCVLNRDTVWKIVRLDTMDFVAVVSKDSGNFTRCSIVAVQKQRSIVAVVFKRRRWLGWGSGQNANARHTVRHTKQTIDLLVYLILQSKKRQSSKHLFHWFWHCSRCCWWTRATRSHWWAHPGDRFCAGRRQLLFPRWRLSRRWRRQTALRIASKIAEWSPPRIFLTAK